MLNLPHQSYVAWRTCITAFHAVAIVSTLWRIRTRYQSRRMWLDDYLVIIPMATDLFFCLSPWVFPWLSPDPRTAGLFDLRKLWATLLVCFTIIWLSRICFMLSLARIFPPGNPSRSYILSLVILFALFFCSVVLLLVLHCDPDDISAQHCVKFLNTDPAAKYTYSIDIISDIIMIITPLTVLWRVKLPRLEKRVILVALSGSTITLPLFVTLIVFTFGPFVTSNIAYTIVTTMLSNLTAAACLLSCNALVVVTSLFRLYRRRGGWTDESTGPEETPNDSSSMSPTGHAPYSVPAFNHEKTKEGTTDSDGSGAPFTLTQITIDDYEHSPHESPVTTI